MKVGDLVLSKENKDTLYRVESVSDDGKLVDVHTIAIFDNGVWGDYENIWKVRPKIVYRNQPIKLFNTVEIIVKEKESNIMNLEVNDLVVSKAKPQFRYRVLWVSDDGKQVDVLAEDRKIDDHWIDVYKMYSHIGLQTEDGLFKNLCVKDFERDS